MEHSILKKIIIGYMIAIIGLLCFLIGLGAYHSYRGDHSEKIYFDCGPDNVRCSVHSQRANPLDKPNDSKWWEGQTFRTTSAR